MGIKKSSFAFLRAAALWTAAFFLAAQVTACEFDRFDKHREDIEDRVAAGDTDDSSVSSDPDTGTSIEQETSPVQTDDDSSAGTDFSCDYAPCTSEEDCSCTANAQCIREGPSMVKDHCFIVDCDPGDPATCPEGKNCIDAGPLSQGILGMVCFNL